MKLRTADALQDFLDQDLIWRRKELTEYKFLLDGSTARLDRRDALLRGGVTLLYAHWEGYVKNAATAYLDFLSYQRLRYEQLATNFLALAARRILRRAGATNLVTSHIEVTTFFRTGLTAQSTIPVKDAVSTRGNLSSDLFAEIVEVLGLDYGPFATKANLIDEGLLAARNTIAHGEFLLVTLDRWEELYVEVAGMLNGVRNAISNAVALQAYLAA